MQHLHIERKLKQKLCTDFFHFALVLYDCCDAGLNLVSQMQDIRTLFLPQMWVTRCGIFCAHPFKYPAGSQSTAQLTCVHPVILQLSKFILERRDLSEVPMISMRQKHSGSCSLRRNSLIRKLLTGHCSWWHGQQKIWL